MWGIWQGHLLTSFSLIILTETSVFSFETCYIFGLGIRITCGGSYQAMAIRLLCLGAHVLPHSSTAGPSYGWNMSVGYAPTLQFQFHDMFLIMSAIQTSINLSDLRIVLVNCQISDIPPPKKRRGLFLPDTVPISNNSFRLVNSACHWVLTSAFPRSMARGHKTNSSWSRCWRRMWCTSYAWHNVADTPGRWRLTCGLVEF